MATPFLVGLGVAGAAMAAKHGLKVAESLASNPEAMKTMGAAGAGFRAMGAKLNPANLSEKLGALFPKGKHAGGFDGTMTRREAALILGVRESVDKAALKEAHRKIMLMNHPARGGSPFIATKINEANECLSGQGRTSGSAFS